MKTSPNGAASLLELERAEGIEPPSTAWRAAALPLNYTRDGTAQYRQAMGFAITNVTGQPTVGGGDSHPAGAGFRGFFDSRFRAHRAGWRPRGNTLW